MFVMLAFSSFLLTSCDDVTTEVNPYFEGAKLLQRGTSIQLGKEWDAVQNTYSDLVSDIKKNPSNH